MNSRTAWTSQEDFVSKNKRAREMAQQIKALAAKLDDLGLIPGTHMVAGEN